MKKRLLLILAVALAGSIAHPDRAAAFAWDPAFDTPPNIATSFDAWISWKDKRVAQFENHAPSERGTTYYFSQSGGHDTNNNGTEGSPYKTVTKCQSLIDAQPQDADIRCRFKRGDMWRGTGGILTVKDNITIDDYGSGEKPFFNAFEKEYLDSANLWTQSGATNAWFLTEARDIAWLRLQGDRLGEVRGTSLIRQPTQTAVSTTANSWYWNPLTGVLSVNLNGDNPNNFDLEAVYSNEISGVIFSGDGNRVENIRGDGWGMHRTSTASQEQPFTNRSSGDDANLFKGLEAYFSGSHVVAHNRSNGATGGKSMWIDIIAGYAKYNSASETIYNTFTDDGGQETWFLNCDTAYGTLPSSDWNYALPDGRAQAFYGHVGSGGLPNPALNVIYESDVLTSIAPTYTLGAVASMPTATTLADVRSFQVNNTYHPQAQTRRHGVDIESNTVLYGNKYYFKTNSVNPSALQNTAVENAWIINSYFDLNHAAVTGSWGLFNRASGAVKAHFWNSYIKQYNSAGNRFGIDYDLAADAATAAGLGHASGSTMVNTIVDYGAAGANQFFALTNRPTIKNNAFYQVDQATNLERGYNNAVGTVTLSAAQTFGVSNAQLLAAGSTDIALSHDINGKRRLAATPDIGPVDFSSAEYFYWVGGADDRFEDADNWAWAPWETGGAGVPRTGDHAIFGRNGGTVRLRSAVNIESLTMLPIWTGSVLQGTGTLVVGNGGIKVGSGRLIGGNAAITVSGNYTQTGGVVTGIQNTMSLADDFSVTKGVASSYSTFTSTGTIALTGSADQGFTVGTNVSDTFGSLTIDNSGGGTADDILLSIDGGLQLTGDLTIGQGNLDLDTNNQSLNVDGDVLLENDAQATMSGATMNFGGNLTVHPDAAFTHTSGTVTLDGTNQTLSGSLAFYNLTKSVTAADTLTFAATETQTILGTLTLNGAAGNLLSLRSSQVGTEWRIDPRGTRTVSYLDVKNSNNIHATDITCPSNCVNSLGNSGWIFQTAPAASSSSVDDNNQGGGGGRRGAGARAHPSAPDTGTDSGTNSSSPAEPSRDNESLTVNVEGRLIVFHDVPFKAWFAEYIQVIVEAGFASGYKNEQGELTGLFGPANPVTYAEIAKMALEAADKDVSAVQGTPSNTSAQDSWSAAYIKLAEDLGLSVFTPELDVNAPATRGAVVQIIIEALGVSLEGGTGGYSDVRETHPYARAIATATKLGLVNGDIDGAGNLLGTFRPDDQINRAEVAKILTMVLDLGL